MHSFTLSEDWIGKQIYSLDTRTQKRDQILALLDEMTETCATPGKWIQVPWDL